VVGVWVVLGVILYFVLRARNPEALNRVGDVYGGEAADDVPVTTSDPVQAPPA
jgi:hypothetical protein